MDISDAVYVLNFLFSGASQPPPDSGPEACGFDPSEDLIDCAASICP